MSMVRMSLYRRAGDSVSWILKCEGSRGRLVVSAQVNNQVVVQEHVSSELFDLSGVLQATGRVYYRATLRDWGMGSPSFVETDGYMEVDENVAGAKGADLSEELTTFQLQA